MSTSFLLRQILKFNRRIRRTQFLTLIHLPSATFTLLTYTTFEIQRYRGEGITD